MIPIVTFLYVAFQVFKAADFEVNTAAELVRESGISTILIGVVLVQLPMELWIAILVGAGWLVSRGRGAPKPVGQGAGGSRLRRVLVTVGLIAAVPIALALAISPWPFVVASLVVLAWAAWVTSSPPTARYRRPVFLSVNLFAIIASVGYLLSLPTIWMGAEDIQTADHGHMVGYVVSSDDRWTTILTPSWTHRLPAQRNSLVRIDSAEIQSRTLCAIDFQDARAFGFQLHLRSFQLPSLAVKDRPPKPLTPPCPSS